MMSLQRYDRYQSHVMLASGISSFAEDQFLHFVELGGAAGLAAAGDVAVEDVTVDAGGADENGFCAVPNPHHLHRGFHILLFHNRCCFFC